MSSLSLRISLRCGACGVVVPVNGLVPGVTCWSCDKPTPLDATVWKMVLDQPLAEAPTLPPQVQRAGSLTTDIGTIHRVYQVSPPHCGSCQATVEPGVLVSALGHQSPGVPCASCRQSVALRPAPADLASKGVLGIAAETEGVKKKRDPVPLACAKCGGGLDVDGSTKLVTCPFCHNQQYLPNELLLALRSTPVRAWSLLLRDGATAARQKTMASWQSVNDVVVDRNGNLYIWGLALTPVAPHADGRKRSKEEIGAMLGGMLSLDDDGSSGPSMCSLFCMAPDMTLRWKLDGLHFGVDAKLAFVPSGFLVLRDQNHAEVRRCDTGALALRFSGHPGEGARLALGVLGQMVVDADGSLVAWTHNDNVLHRFDATGHPIAMWGVGPPQDLSREVSNEPWGPMVHELKNKPTRVHSVVLATGWDGHLYLQSSLNMHSQCALAAFDRQGHRLYTAKLAVQDPSFEERPAIDGYGRVYVWLPNEGGSVYRVENGGRNVIPFAISRKAGGLFGGEKHIACTPDGSLFAVGGSGRFRVFSPEGRVTFLSPGAMSADEGKTSPLDFDF